MKIWDTMDNSNLKLSSQEQMYKNTARLKKSDDSNNSSGLTNDKSSTKKSSDLGEHGNAIYHDKDSSMEMKKEKEKLFRKKLNYDIRKINSNTIHKNIKLIVHRPEITDLHKIEYSKIYSEIKILIHELEKRTSPLLEYTESFNFSKNKFYGTKFLAENISKKDFRYFGKKSIYDHNPSIAVSIRIDESASMSSYGRLDAAKKSCVAVYEFCNILNIPICIYGDTADKSKLEQMSLFSYIDFENKQEDDKYRLMDIKARSNNRDGMALNILAEKLSNTQRNTKLLINITDGLPKAMPNYSGNLAIDDIKNVINKYKQKGIIFLSCAIGHDKDSICGIYGRENFVDITNLDTLPSTLVKIIKKYM